MLLAYFCPLLLVRGCGNVETQMEANPEVKEAAMREMMLVSEEMSQLLKQHRIHFPKMILSMFGQFPVFISLFLATRDVRERIKERRSSAACVRGGRGGGVLWVLNRS